MCWDSLARDISKRNEIAPSASVLLWESLALDRVQVERSGARPASVIPDSDGALEP